MRIADDARCMARTKDQDHWVLCSSNTEYHLRGSECVGVRSRASGAWQRRHVALRLRVEPGLVDDPEAALGRTVLLASEHFDVETAPIVALEVADELDLPYYVNHVAVGSIRRSEIATQRSQGARLRG